MPDMTGLERLRELADDMYGIDLWSNIRGSREDKYDTYEGDGKTVNGLLRAIADQIEAEQEERITRRVEDREAAEWVRRRGGLDAVRERWAGRIARAHVENMAERQRERRERMQRHIEYIQRLCRERRERIGELNREIADMRPRLMPEGMEWLVEAWPRFEDDAPVAFQDKGLDVHGHARSVEGVKFTQGGFVFISDDMGRAWWANDQGPTEDPCVSPAKRVKRPAPKVLDADGAEIRIGDEVFDIETGKVHHAATIDPAGKRFRSFEQMSDDTSWLDSMCFTHRAPVLAADGEPLEVGQTVYVIANGKTHHVTEIDTMSKRFKSMEQVDGSHWLDPMCFTHQSPVLDADGVPIREGDTVYLLPGEWCGAYPLRFYSAGDEMVVKKLCQDHGVEGVLMCVGDGKCDCFPLPYQLTHTKPEPCDSWERLEKDAAGIERDCGGTWHKPDGSSVNVVDIVRRAKELAERERGE